VNFWAEMPLREGDVLDKTNAGLLLLEVLLTGFVSLSLHGRFQAIFLLGKVPS